MKGIAHFVTGIAVATLFPEVVGQASEGSLLPVLGGIAALLPDTLDFKVLRYLQSYDLEIDPGPEPNARSIAAAVAGAAREAYHTGESRRVMLHTVRLGPDRWRRYEVRFNREGGEVAVAIGPVVDTGQRPEPGSAIETGKGAVPLSIPIDSRSHPKIVVDIFSGPSLTFRRRGDRLHLGFIDWHRRWSHSLTFAAALGIGTAGLVGLISLLRGGPPQSVAPHLAGLLVGLGLLVHILQDQLGFMGSNLFFPITRRRTPGLGLIHSGDAVPNFLTVWAALMLILFNLDRFSAQPRLPPGSVFFGLMVLLPGLVLGGLYVRRRRQGLEKRAYERDEIVSELEDAGIS